MDKRDRNMSKNLITYLNDHLAGSVAALELLDHLIEIYQGKPLERFYKGLRSEIDADQGELQDLIEGLGEKESLVRKAGLWVAEKLSRAKIRLSDSEENRMSLFHALEGLVVCITGKRSLWTAQAAAADTVPELRVQKQISRTHPRPRSPSINETTSTISCSPKRLSSFRPPTSPFQAFMCEESCYRRFLITWRTRELKSLNHPSHKAIWSQERPLWWR